MSCVKLLQAQRQQHLFEMLAFVEEGFITVSGGLVDEDDEDDEDDLKLRMMFCSFRNLVHDMSSRFFLPAQCIPQMNKAPRDNAQS